MNSLPNGTDSPDTSSISLVNWRPGLEPARLSRTRVGMCLAWLTRAFPTLQLDPQFVWEHLSDLTDTMVERAVLILIQTKRDVYPGTNWIAEIRMTAIAGKTSADDLTEAQRIRLKELG